jgi:uncharacterized protein with PIN domain
MEISGSPGENEARANEAVFRFYEELNDFLPPKRIKADLVFEFTESPSVKDAMESLGVPHPEVDLILVNGRSVDFSYRLKNKDRVSVFPVFESLDVSGLSRLRERPLRNPLFLLDAHLGRLARLLRLLGFDSLYDGRWTVPGIMAAVMREPGRILLTRSRALLKRNSITRGYWIRSSEPEEQVKDVLRRFDLFSLISPFTLCLVCNGRIEPVNKAVVHEQLPEKVRLLFEDFTRCPSCQRIYWQGTHHERMQAFIRKIQPGRGPFEPFGTLEGSGQSECNNRI